MGCRFMEPIFPIVLHYYLINSASNQFFFNAIYRLPLKTRLFRLTNWFMLGKLYMC